MRFLLCCWLATGLAASEPSFEPTPAGAGPPVQAAVRGRSTESVCATSRNAGRRPPREADSPPDADRRRTLLQLDPQSPQATHAVPQLIDLVKERTAPLLLRRQAAMLLGRIGVPARQAVPVLAELLSENEPVEPGQPTVVYWVSKALGEFGPVARDAVPALVSIAEDGHRRLSDRTVTIEALGRIGAVHPDVVPTLLALLRQSMARRDAQSVRLRTAVCESLSLLGTDAAPALPLLLRAAQDDDVGVREMAILAIGAVGPRAEIALTTLADAMLVDPAPTVRHNAGMAMSRIGAPAIPYLVAMLDDDEPAVRCRALESLGRMGRIAATAREPIAQALTNSDPTVRISAAEAWWSTGGEAERVLPAVVTVLRSDDRQLRRRAVTLLEQMGPAAQSAVPEIRKLLDDRNSAVRRAAREALERIERVEP